MIDSALRAFGLEELARSNGHSTHGFPAICHGCGQSFVSARKPTVRRHAWCDTCRAEGKPGKQRQADFRARSRIAK